MSECLSVSSTLALPVTVVEADLLHNNVAEEMPDSREEGGQLKSTVIPSPHRQRVDDDVKGGTNKKDVHRYQLESFLVLYPAHLYTAGGKEMSKNCNTCSS